MASPEKAARRAAIKAEKAKLKEEKKAAQDAGGTEALAAAQTKEAKPQVAASAVTAPEVAKPTPNPVVEKLADKSVGKPTPAPEKPKPNSAQQTKPAQQQTKKEPKVPTIIAEEVEVKPVDKESVTKKMLKRAVGIAGSINAIPIGSNSSSVDGKAMLAHVMWEKYGKNEELQKRYPELFNDLMQGIDVVVLLSMVDVRNDMMQRSERGELKLVVSPDQLIPLQSMANMLGIELAAANALPGSPEQLAINFQDSVIPEELARGLVKVATIPELDPNKVTTDEEIKAALEHLIKNGGNIAENIVNTVEWYRTLKLTKETDTDKRLAIDDKTVAEWIAEIFSIVEATGIFNGLGRTLYMYSSQTGSPCMSHAILHKHIAKCGWSEDQIASTLKALIEGNFRYKLKDDNTLQADKDKALNAVIGTLGTEYVDSIMNASKGEKGVEKDSALKIIGCLRTAYFAKEDKVTDAQMRMLIGQIINYYRDPKDRLAEFQQSCVTAQQQGEYPTASEPEKKNQVTGQRFGISYAFGKNYSLNNHIKMTVRVLSVVSMFIVSIFIGYNMFNSTEKLQAQTPVVPSYLEMLSISKSKVEERPSVTEIDVSIDLSTKEVTVKGTSDAIVNISTFGEPTPIVKYKTKLKRDTVSTGYPYVNSIGKLNADPISPFSHE